MPGIIKGQGGADPQGTSRALFNFEDIAQKAREHLAAARQEGERIVAEAHREAEKVRSQARREATAEALVDAKRKTDEEAQQRLASALPALNRIAQRLEEQREAWRSHWERQAVRLAVLLAEKVVRRELRGDPGIPLAWIRESLDLIGRQEKVTIELAPADLDTLHPRIDDLVHQLGRMGEVRLVANQELTPGDCRVETVHGEFDHRLETQLSRLESELT